MTRRETSNPRQAILTNRQDMSVFLTGLIKSWSQDPQLELSQHYRNSLWLPLAAKHNRDSIHQLKVLLVFIEFNIVICILMGRQRRMHLNPAASPSLQTPQPPPQPAPRRRRKKKKKHTKSLDHALDPLKTRKGILQQPPGRPHTLISQETRILSGCPLLFLTSSRNTFTIASRSKSLVFQEAIRSWTETDNNAETPGKRRDLHLLAVSLVGCPHHHLQISPPPQVCQSILAEYQDEYLGRPDSPDDWKRVKEKFKTRWNVSHAVATIDRKHIPMKKQKETGSDYYNYKGFFSLVLLVHRFLWIDCGSSG